MSDVIITVGTADLRAALSSVVVHAGNDEHLPTYTRVRMIVDPINLTVIATDRFSMAMAIVSIWEQVEPGFATIDVLPEDVKKILSIFKAGKEKADSDAPEFQVRFEADDEFVTVVDCAGFVDGRSYKIPRLPTDEQFLDVPRMVSRSHHAAPVLLEDMAVNGPLLARFAVAATAYLKPLLIESHTGFRSLLIRAGESFLGMLMPLNIGEEDAARNKEWSVAWSSRLPDPAHSNNHDEAAS
ncbi:hypothetical protein CH296_27970 [Rhodococcus sp. 14-2496-1d]|uniref:hypothetical protein n=1 Tax=Rhodococcus sp. 14-2496-1d TaxID=2023146 RepID=UPI000B9A8F2E|nr:hypothetical protein [Rhodococcus sp. 14-2496-1d]OZF25201.1 hypothetical protein CH296_27970 [Rhodococcus sp. 14-2496-1d]